MPFVPQKVVRPKYEEESMEGEGKEDAVGIRERERTRDTKSSFSLLTVFKAACIFFAFSTILDVTINRIRQATEGTERGGRRGMGRKGNPMEREGDARNKDTQ